MKPEDEVLGDGLSDAIPARDREQLHDLMDGRLTEDEAEALHQRLECEPALHQALQELQKLGTWLRDEWDRAEAPAMDPRHLADRVLARTLAAVPASSLPHLEAPERLATWEFREATTVARRFPWTLVSGFAAASVVVAGATWFIWNQWASSDYEHLLPPTRSEAQILSAEKARVDLKDLHSKPGAERAKAKDAQDVDSVMRESTEQLVESVEAGVGTTNKQMEPTANPEAEAQKIERPSVYCLGNAAQESLAEPPVVVPNEDRNDEFFARGIRNAWRDLGVFFIGAGAADAPASEARQADPDMPAIEFDKLADERLLNALRLQALAEVPEAPEVREVEAGERASKRETADLGRFEAAWREEDRQALRECARIVVDRYEVVAAEREFDRAGHPEIAKATPRLTVEQSHVRAEVAWNALQSEWTQLGSAASRESQVAGSVEVQADRGLAAGFVLPAVAAEDVLLLKLTVKPGHAAASIGQTIESLGLRSIALASAPVSNAESKNALASEDAAAVSELYLGWLDAAPAQDVAQHASDNALRFMFDPLLEGQHAVSGSIVASATIQLALVQAVQEAEVDQWLVQADAENGAPLRLKDDLSIADASETEELKREEAKKEKERLRAKSAAPAGPATPGDASRDLPSTPGAPAARQGSSSTPTLRGTAGGGHSPTSPRVESGAPATPAEQPPDRAPEPTPSASNQPSAVKPDDAMKALEVRLAKAVRERVNARPLRVMVVLLKQSDSNSNDKQPRDK